MATGSALTIQAGGCSRPKVADIEKIRVDLQLAPGLREAMIEKTGRRTVPQIYIGETHVVGFDDLRRARPRRWSRSIACRLKSP